MDDRAARHAPAAPTCPKPEHQSDGGEKPYEW